VNGLRERERVARSRVIGAAVVLCAGMVAVLLMCAPAAGQENACSVAPAGTCYGNGENEDRVFSASEALERDMNYRNMTVMPGVTLDTAGFTVRVCETLTNNGTITDSQSGGDGGDAGVGGPGEDHWGTGSPAQPGTCGGGGINREGKGGGGGGGGGGAWILSGAHLDADGGDGGDGGEGGQGGGTVRIYAYRLVNNGLIHADGGNGGDGTPGEDGEYTRDPLRSCKDIAGGGGGGGGGGDGGDGGILEIRYADPTSTLGTYHANGGPGGVGAAGGLRQCLVCGDYPPGYEFLGPGAPGCDEPPEGGDGGDGAYEEDTCSESGTPGSNGATGAPGQVTIVGPWQACCLQDHSCVSVDVQCCAELGGTSLGDGTECGEVAACVFSDHTCEDLDPGCCASFGGTPYPGELCGLQACCFDGTSTCEDLSAENCLQQGGQPAGPGTQCTGSRACYFEEGPCRDLDPECCVLIGGTPGGPYCDEQACCFEDRTCAMLEPPDCTSQGGLPMGSDTVCDGMECPQACWFSDDHCENLPPSECLGIPIDGWCKGEAACCWGEDNTCRTIDALFCPLLGLPGGGGTPQPPGAVCTELRACCLPDGGCVMVDPVCCDEAGGEISEYGPMCLGDNDLDGRDDGCQLGPGQGACCYFNLAVQTCVEVTETECTTLGGYRFRIGQECPEDISIFCYPPPANDTCATAIDYVACPTNFDSTGAETDVLLTDPPADLGFQPQNDVYFKYQIPASGAYSPAYTDGLIVITTYGSDFDTCIACYQNSTDTNCPNFDCNDLQILDTGAGQSDGVNDDMVSGLRYTSIARLKVSQFGASGLKPGDCVLIRVAGLPASHSATPPGGQGVLRVDFLPFLGGQYASDVGVCCLPAGCQIQRSVNAAADCRAAGGWFRAYTDFLEGAPAPGYDNAAAGGAVPQVGGCCSTYPCEQGDFAGKPYVLPAFVQKDVPVTMTVNRHNVTYFQFQTPLVIGETAAVSIDTCGTPFDTILSIYRYNQPTDLDDAGDVHGGMEVGDEHTETPLFRNDNCWGVDPQASCFSDPDSLDSCMCLTVGEGADLTTTTWYIVKVGMKDERALAGGYVRADGIDPVANWPYDPEVPVTITLTWHDECVVCLTDCCKGDMDNSEMSDMADVPIFVDAVLRRGAFAGGLECDQWAFCTADMNNDYQVNGEDIEDFMFAVIYGWDCTPDQINCMDEDPDYCQIRNGGTFTPSDLKSGGENHYTVVDNFSSLSGGYINQICWWGVFMTFDGGWTGDCGPGSGTFRITYFNDAGGIPGTVKAGPFTVTPTQTVIDTINFGTYTADEYMMDATHPLVRVGRDECVWVEITADNGSGNCHFLWESAGPGDLVSFQDEDSNGYQRSDRQAGDQAFCVNALLNQFACLDTECDPECPGGDAIIEGETGLLDPCSNEDHVDTVNGGCDSNPTTPPLVEIDCDSIVCGTAGWWTQLEEAECDHDHDCPEGQVCSGHICTGGPYEMLYRDTDWYTLTLLEEQEVTLTVNAGDVEFPYMIGFMTGTDCSDPNLGIEPRATGLPCQPATVRACLPPGEHWIFFAPWACWLPSEAPSGDGPPPVPPPIPPWQWRTSRGAPPDLIGCEREYVFSVTCGDCPYCQNPTGTLAVLSDDSTNWGRNWVADNFRPSEPGGVTRAHWYGVNEGFGLDEWTECEFLEERYTIRYYLDDGSGSQGYAGLPGSFLVEHVIGSNFTKTDTGAVLGDSRVWEYTATHPMVPVNAGQCYWVSIVQDAANQNCAFRWHSNLHAIDGQGDGVSATSGNQGASWGPGGPDVGDVAFCVNVAAEAEGCGVDVAAADLNADGSSHGGDIQVLIAYWLRRGSSDGRGVC